VDELIGKQLGQYEIIDEIGRGGMATVYRARQPSINRMVAIKVLPRHFLHDPSFIERFKREVDVISRLEHPHILPIYDYGETDGVPFIAMRYLPGGSLAQFLRRGRPSLEALERPLTQIAEALDYAHRQGIVHRDLKPGNILLDDNGNAYLTDFGVARIMNSNLTGSAIIGTPAYMSPEQANGLPLDGRSDIYALGVVLFEMLTGREPYEAPTPMALLLKHISEPMPSARSIRPELSRAIEAVIDRSTAKDPNDRYPSATEMAAAYAQALRKPQTDEFEPPTLIVEGDTNATIPPPTGKRAPAVPAAVPAAPPPPAPAKPARTPAALYAGLIGAVIVLLIIGGVLVMSGLPVESSPIPTPTPFAGGSIVRREAFQITIPGDWTATVESDEDPLVTRWQSRVGDAYVRLSLIEADLDNDTEFMEAIESYATAPLDAPDRQFIDETRAEDGSLRRSYRLVGEGDVSAGQIDLFYLSRDSYLVVLETYSAYSSGNAHVPTFQAVLDSLRVDADS
jgi:serine/threonine-protein kinase